MATEQTAAYVIVSSDSPGATWASSDPGSEIRVSLASPIRLDTDHINKASLIDAAVFFASPNVGPASLGLGNGLRYENTNAANGPIGIFDILFAEGLYSLDDLNATIARETLSAGFGTPLAPFIVLSSDNGAQRVILTITTVGGGVTIHWTTGPNPITDLLGFVGDLGPTALASEYFIAPNRANFSQGIQSYIINLDIISGSYLGGVGGTALANIPLNAAPNQQIIVDSPSTLLEVNVGSATIGSLRAWITDQAGRRLVLREPWSFSFVVRRKTSSIIR